MIRNYCLLFLLLLGATTLRGQNYLKSDSPLLGMWVLSSPKKSPGPEFIPESYKGMTHLTFNAGNADSEASGMFNKKTSLFDYAIKFIAEWDGTKLTGTVTIATWTTEIEKLKINVPLAFDTKKGQILIHINNPEYGDVTFIYKKMKW